MVDVKALIHPSPGAGSEIEYEPGSDYADMDAVDEDDVAGYETELSATLKDEPEPVAAPESDVDWRAIAQAQQAELAKFKTVQAEQEKADFERRVKELPEAERSDFVINFYRERERAAEMETVRKSQAESHPLSTVLLGPVMERFDIEIDDPAVYAEAMNAMEAKYSEIINSIVAEGVKREMDKFYAGAGVQWGASGLGGSQPRPLQSQNPIRNQYEQTHKELRKPGIKTEADLQKLIRQRDQAKRQGR
jgi:hypothetical protein